MNRWKENKEPRHGLSNLYKSRAKARRMADVLSGLYASRGWKYAVLQFQSNPARWIVMRDCDADEGMMGCPVHG